MNRATIIKINFRGGIISPGELYNILIAATNLGITDVRFGLRQQLFIETSRPTLEPLAAELNLLGVGFETGTERHPNIVSSYPAEEIFIRNTWLSEGVYKDIFDAIDYRPSLKINISDSNQSFTPSLTGNINWVASADAQHFWHLLIRFPKTNIIHEWDQLVYTNDISRLSRDIETVILRNRDLFYDNRQASGKRLFEKIETGRYNTKPAEKTVALPLFNLPYYEGLNLYNEKKYWLGIYRRHELFDAAFLKELCLLCLDTRIGQLCATPWKTIIVKGIEEADRGKWSRLLEKHEINMRHAANELNFQVEDNCTKGLALKRFLVKKLNRADLRSFGLCIGIKTKQKTEIFSSILIKRKPLLRLGGLSLLPVYDILCARNFNPNERTGFVFSQNNFRFGLTGEIRRAIQLFYKEKSERYKPADDSKAPVPEMTASQPEQVYQCGSCLSVYEPALGEPSLGIAAGTGFEALMPDFNCPVCSGPKAAFSKIEKHLLGLQTV